MALSNVSGFPRIGPERELKFATEGYWRGEVSDRASCSRPRSGSGSTTGASCRSAGIDLIPSNDFSLYDQVLDTIALVGAVPERYGHGGGPVGLDTYFAMARGRQESGVDVTAMEMTKWFDTNYHYIVPELGPGHELLAVDPRSPSTSTPRRWRSWGSTPCRCSSGPVSFLLLGKSADGVARGLRPPRACSSRCSRSTAR